MSHPYFPLKKGARWTYSTSQRYGAPAGEPEGRTGASCALQSTVEVVAVRTEGSRAFAEIVTRWTGPAPSESRQQWIVTREGLLPSSGPMQTSAGEVHVASPSGIYLPSVLDVQLPWSYALELDTPLHRLRVSGSSRLVGFEAIAVPAGRFEAAHVRSRVRTEMEPKFDTVPAADQVQEEDLYYVRGVGLVRATQAIASGYASDKVLVSFLSG